MVFLEFPYFLCDPMNVGSLISGPPTFSKPSLYIWNFSIHIVLKPSFKDFDHYLARMWNESYCVVAWTFFGIALFWDWNENWPFPVLWLLLSFPNLRTDTKSHMGYLIHHIPGLGWPQCEVQEPGEGEGSIPVRGRKAGSGERKLEWKLTFSSPVTTAGFSIFVGILSATL